MFSFKDKLDPVLKDCINNNSYKNYRVIVECRSIRENIENKIKTYKGQFIHSIPLINCFSADITPHAIERLIEYPEVSHICLDDYALLCGSSVLAANGTKFQEKYKLTGKGIGIGIIDSGVYPHQDLIKGDNRIKYFLDVINNYKYPYDDNGHGTFISGIICGNGNLSKGLYRGIAEESNIYSVKAFNSIGRGFISDILFSLNALIEESQISNIKVICLPFELMDYNLFTKTLFYKLFNECVKLGITVVVPAGNNGNSESSIRGIATLSNCITVGGIDTRREVGAYELSSSGPFGKIQKPDLAAACVDICSLNSDIFYIPERNKVKLYPKTLDKPYTYFSGTSCAAAYISGVCALLYENKPDIGFNDILSLLKISCHMREISTKIQGAGMLDLNVLLP
jgi:serine protease AprX